MMHCISNWLALITVLCCLVIARPSLQVLGELQQQAFRITPNDIEAHLGDEVVLRCEIERLAGRVQWTKDGFALGFSNKILGYPRFSLNQNHSTGVFNLRITNASVEDAASYQCQVGPAKHNQPIRAGAKLTVLGSTKGHHGICSIVTLICNPYLMFAGFDV